MTDVDKTRATLVDALGSAVRSGDHGLKTVPALLKRVLAEDAWQEFVTQRGERVRHERFADFVTAKPLRGLGADVELIRRIVAADVEALDLLDRALQNPVGAKLPRSDSDNITISDRGGGRGTSKEYALRRLRKDAPELHTEVLAGKLSAHAAMVQAGFTPKRFTVPVTSARSVADALRRKLPPELLDELAVLLADPDARTSPAEPGNGEPPPPPA